MTAGGLDRSLSPKARAQANLMIKPTPSNPIAQQQRSPSLTAGVLRFWFEQSTPKQWFQKDPAYDLLITSSFGALVDLALAGDVDMQHQQPADNLALVLLLDQFTRHIYRDTPNAFAGDDLALALTEQALRAGWVQHCPDANYRKFWLMPMMHSESIEVQRASLTLFERHTDADTLHFAKRHCEIIERFGRFPHRNAILKRISTDDEIAFLAQPGSSF
ncbi:MAG: DUF924 domain-containing protein [Burkholderiaceae bacterium]|nr:DUF924 domain-containing protein [Burkholderiaceae bacterium]MCD8516962.1 DUF924 domain-containing protein [Burkholderiaceae bacterium]MCD8536794.1 DUF924 domain-containing protein [Burkholderiaceae bacterium]MCD8565670.1 DUF924 domain-containing protein [Burkholderiaceae bacterium]